MAYLQYGAADLVLGCLDMVYIHWRMATYGVKLLPVISVKGFLNLL